MKVRNLLFSGATAALLLTAGTLYTGPLGFTPQAKADVDVNISVGTFYDRLSPYGGWVSYGGANVFVPRDREVGWRPYTRGHWEHTRQYGWMWVSDEPFGWATYHYGRWAFADDIGWYWLPGRRWAPAWVSWRSSDEDVVWAPLPPRRGDDDIDISFNLTVGDPPDDDWVVVPARRFLAPNIAVVVIRDNYERRRIWQRVRPLGGVTIVNNIVVNNVINVDYIERRANRKVRTVEVERTRDPSRAGRRKGNAIEIFDADVKADPTAKPKALANIDEVKQRQAKRRARAEAADKKQGDDNANVGQGDNGQQLTDQQLKQRRAERRKNRTGAETDQTGQAQTGQENPAQNDRKKRRQQQMQNQQQTDQTQTDQQNARKKRRQQQMQNQQQTDQTQTDQQNARKKRRQQQMQNQQQTDQTQTDQQNARKKRRQEQMKQQMDQQQVDQQQNQNARRQRRQQQMQQQQQQMDQQQQQNQQRRKRKNQQCDPSVNPNCPQ